MLIPKFGCWGVGGPCIVGNYGVSLYLGSFGCACPEWSKSTYSVVGCALHGVVSYVVYQLDLVTNDHGLDAHGRGRKGVLLLPKLAPKFRNSAEIRSVMLEEMPAAWK